MQAGRGLVALGARTSPELHKVGGIPATEAETIAQSNPTVKSQAYYREDCLTVYGQLSDVRKAAGPDHDDSNQWSLDLGIA